MMSISKLTSCNKSPIFTIQSMGVLVTTATSEATLMLVLFNNCKLTHYEYDMTTKTDVALIGASYAYARVATGFVPIGKCK